MKNLKKKGFTIVELVIVIAVIAVLAAVLIPTFVNLTRKANISADTVLAKNLNTAAISASADTFEEAIAAVKESGYLLANLNAKATDCYFVWEDDSNQFLLYNLENSEVIYSNDTNYGEIDSSWCFTVSNSTVAESVQALLSNITIKKTVTDVKDLKQALAEGGEIYIDESVILNKDNYLNLTDANIEINFGNSSLMTDGTLDGIIPIVVNSGTVVINGGYIGATGTNIDIDGNEFSTCIRTYDDTDVTINDTKFHSNDSIIFTGTSTLNNVSVNQEIYTARNGQTILNNCNVESESSMALWVTNTLYAEGTSDGTATITVKSGKYSVKAISNTYGVVSVLGGTINIENGEFTSAENSNNMFYVCEDDAKIVITGGTFDGKTFEQLVLEGETAWQNLCLGNYSINISSDNKTVTITK